MVHTTGAAKQVAFGKQTVCVMPPGVGHGSRLIMVLYAAPIHDAILDAWEGNMHIAIHNQPEIQPIEANHLGLKWQDVSFLVSPYGRYGVILVLGPGRIVVVYNFYSDAAVVMAPASMRAGSCNRDMASHCAVYIPVYRIMDTELTALEDMDT
jgi:hypothetical protein